MSSNKIDKSLFNKSWAFNKIVTKNFDTHVRQSIPNYQELQKYLAKISEWFLFDNSIVYDLGCSTGETIKQLYKLNISTRFKIIGIDNNVNMLKLANKKIKSFKKENIKTNFVKGDLNKLKLKKCNLVYSVFTFPFINIENRKKLLKKIHSSLSLNGALIVIEKIRSQKGLFEDILNQLYFDFKKSKKLSSKHILNKSKLLRSGMHVLTVEQSLNLLKQSGFKNYEIFYKNLNFIGYIAVKGN